MNTTTIQYRVLRYCIRYCIGSTPSTQFNKMNSSEAPVRSFHQSRYARYPPKRRGAIVSGGRAVSPVSG